MLGEKCNRIFFNLSNLHIAIFWISVFTGMVVLGIMFYAIFKNRLSRGSKATHFHANVWVECIWAIMPLIILVLMAMPAVKLLALNECEKIKLSIKTSVHSAIK